MAIEIKLQLTAQLKDAAGIGTDTLSIEEGQTFQEVLKTAAKGYGEAFESILFDEDGNYRHSNLIVVNQAQVNFEDEVVLNNGDEITLMSPIAGG